MEIMLRLRYETDMPAGDQVYLSCNVSVNKEELKKNICWCSIEYCIYYKGEMPIPLKCLTNTNGN